LAANFPSPFFIDGRKDERTDVRMHRWSDIWDRLY